MTLDDVLTTLSRGELSNHSMSKGGSIVGEKIPTIVQHLNDALLRLYARFILKENEVIIEQVEHITQYHLKSEFSESHGNAEKEPYLYIKDSLSDPFSDDVIKVLEVYDSVCGKLPLNDPDQYKTVRTPQPTTLQVPNPIQGRSMSVIYQASHPILDAEDLNAPIDLPLVLHKAMTAYVGSKVYSDMGGQENLIKSQENLSHYESICAEAVDRDLVNTSYSSTNTKFTRKGWV